MKKESIKGHHSFYCPVIHRWTSHTGSGEGSCLENCGRQSVCQQQLFLQNRRKFPLEETCLLEQNNTTEPFL